MHTCICNKSIKTGQKRKEQIWNISYLLTCKQGKIWQNAKIQQSWYDGFTQVCILIFYMIEICQKSYGKNIVFYIKVNTLYFKVIQ